MHVRTQYTPLTTEEQSFAESNHYVVEQFLKRNQLDFYDWYDVVIFRYLLAVKKWHQRPELHKWKFSTIAGQDMRSAVGNERQKNSCRIQTASLDEIIPGTEGITYMEKITAENLDYINYGVYKEAPLKEKRRHRPKQEDLFMLEDYLKSRKRRDLRIAYDTREEAESRAKALYDYRKKHKLQNRIRIHRENNIIYVAKIKGGRK